MAKDPWSDRLNEEDYKFYEATGNEPPFSGKLLHNNKDGDYLCAVCGSLIFDSSTKFESNSGWPSFNSPVNNRAVKLTEDNSHGMHRVEVSCAKCGSHLGHVFNDGWDQPTGMRFCINSAALDFKESKAK